MRYLVNYDSLTGEIIAILRSSDPSCTITPENGQSIIQVSPEQGEMIKDDKKKFKIKVDNKQVADLQVKLDNKKENYGK